MVKAPELNEKDFIQENYSKDPLPLWLWLSLLLVIFAMFWGGSYWYQEKMEAVLKASPFLQVTNRQLSLFLWQHPEFMRVNAKEKGNYLPGFLYTDKVTADVAAADDYAVAPPEVLFRYHTWDRLLKGEFIPTPIPKAEFLQFLSYDEQWQPGYWPAAPKAYGELVEGLAAAKQDEQADLAALPLSALPQDVRLAFQGWKNYFKDGEAINHLRPTLGQAEQFLAAHPHYARNYWRNVVREHTPNYLVRVGQKGADPQSVIAADELTGFLRAAFFNYFTIEKPSE